MRTRFAAVAGVIVVVSLSFRGATVARATTDAGDERPPVDPASYPSLDAKELGSLRYSMKIADLAIDDFSLIPLTDYYGWPGTGEKQKDMSSARYTLAFMTYFLALEQFHKLPAYTAALKPRFDRLIQKMLHRKVWEYWAEVSKGTTHLEPRLDRPYASEKAHNIMYSGHLVQMLMLYEKLYADPKYATPGAIGFDLSMHERAVYDTHSLIKTIYTNFLDMPAHCQQCERNACFPVCNQHPILALLLYDQIYGTRYFPEASELLLDWYLKNDLIDPDDHTVAAMHLLKQDKILAKRSPRLGNRLDVVLGALSTIGFLGTYSAAIDGWNGVFMNTWAPELVREHYPYQVANTIAYLDEDHAYTKRGGLYDQISAPFFAAMAAEMGDTKLRDQLLNWAERQYKAGFDSEGYYVYPSWIEVPVPLWPGYSFKGIPMTDKVAAMARANVPDGMRRLHLEPFPGADPSAPILAELSADFMASRAIFDAERGALIVSVEPSPTAGILGRVVLDRLAARGLSRLWVDGKPRQLSQGADTVTLQLDASSRHDIVLARAPANSL
jgi:hypothetical protein